MWLYVDILQVSISCFISCYNIASKFVYSNSIARACFIFLLCTLMTSANESLKKKIFHWVENVIKQLVHTSAVCSLRYEALGKFREHSRVALSYALSNSSFLSALQTSQVLHILMNAQLMYEPIVLWHFQPDRKFVFSRICLLTSWACTLGIWSTLVQLNLITQIY